MCIVYGEVFNIILLCWNVQESTYGTHIHEKREDRENRFTSKFKFDVNFI